MNTQVHSKNLQVTKVTKDFYNKLRTVNATESGGLFVKNATKSLGFFFVDPNLLKNLTSKRENLNSTVQIQNLYVHYYKTVHAVKIYTFSMPLMHSAYLLLVNVNMTWAGLHVCIVTIKEYNYTMSLFINLSRNQQGQVI